MIALVAMAGACGSSGSTTTSSVTPTPTPTPSPKETLIAKADACTLVTAADVLSATGTTVASGTNGVQIPGACIYASADGATSVFVFAQTYSDATSAQAISPEQVAAAFNGVFGIANATVVNGIGDKAIEYSSTSGGSTGAVIFVFKSNVVLLINLTPATGMSAIEQLARTAVGRL